MVLVAILVVAAAALLAACGGSTQARSESTVIDLQPPFSGLRVLTLDG